MVSCRRSYEVASKMISGEILYRKGLFEEAFIDLREGVILDDNLPFDEPWGNKLYFLLDLLIFNFIYLYLFIYIYIYLFIFIFIYLYLYLFIYIYLFIFICLYLYLFIFLFI
jgi:hypothetical protein